MAPRDPVRLYGNTVDKLEVVVRDDLSSQILLTAIVSGHVVNY
jgi:hypothetical protein